GGQAWLMMSDVCKHCQNASCLEVCPTNAIVRTEYDSVFIQQDVCNGCRDCISACPYGVIGFNEKTGTAHKCTLCYDRLQNGLQPACAKACPTESIKFGYLDDLQAAADKRLAALQTAGYKKAQLYGRDAKVYGGLNAFFLLLDEPEVYKLPSAQNATLPSRNNFAGYACSFVTAVLGLVAGVLAFRSQRMNEKTDAARCTFRRAAELGVVDPRVLLLRWNLRRLVRDRHAAPARRHAGRSACRAPRIHHELRRAPAVPAVPHRRPGPAAPLRQHAAGRERRRALVQALVADVARLVG